MDGPQNCSGVYFGNTLKYIERESQNEKKGGSGGACPPGSCRHGGSPYKKISGYNVNIFAQCAFQVPVRLFCGELCFVHVTAPGKKMNILAGFANVALHVNRHPSVSKSADII